MAQLLQAPTEGYEDAIVVSAITADHFELKHGLLTLRFVKSFSEARDIFKDLLRACPRHGFSELHQLDTFYNALNSKDQDSLNSAAGCNFLDNMPREYLAIIESKSKDMVKALLLEKKSQNQAPTTVKAVEESCVTCGGAHSYRNFPATDGNVYHENIQEFISQASAAIKDTVHPTNNGSTKDVQPQVVQSKFPILTSEPVNSPTIKPITSLIIAPRPNQKLSIPYPSRMHDQKLHDKANDQCEKFFPIFKDLNFNISFADALILMTKKAECLALVDLDASINLMPLSVWNKISLPDLTPTCMTLELADRLISRPVRVAEDVYVKVGSFHFSADFVVVDFDANPRVPLILGRSFLKTGRALIDVFKGELTLRIGKEAITYNLDQTSRFSANYSDMMAKRINGIDMAYEEYSQEVLGFSDVITSGNPILYYDPIVSTTSSTLTPYGNSDFLLKEVDAFLAIEIIPLYRKNYIPEARKELKNCEAKSDKSSIDEPPEVELKDLHPHLEYVFSEGDDKFLVIITKDLSVEEKTALITVLKSHKRAIAWKLSDIKGIDPEFCTHKTLMKRTSNQQSNIREVQIPKSTMSSNKRNSDFLLEEVDAFLDIQDDPISPGVDQSYLDFEGDVLLLEAFFNDDPSLPPPNQRNYMPEARKELKICEAKSDKSSIDEPPEVELKDLPPHLEYVFLEGDDKFLVIIAKDLSVEEKTALITVLKSHKRAIAWKLSDIKGIDPEFCTHKTLMKRTSNQQSNIREVQIPKSTMSSNKRF
nr:hypothetical protein [Tanacetum cinerariifolium]